MKAEESANGVSDPPKEEKSKVSLWRILRSLNGHEVKNKNHTAIDIETRGLDASEDGSSFIIGMAKDERGAQRFDNRDSMVSWLTSRENRGRVVWAHNGGRFDYISLFGNYIKKYEPIMVGGKLIVFSVWDAKHNHRVQFCDSINLFPGPLSRLGLAMKMEKGHTPPKFIHGRCGAICVNPQIEGEDPLPCTHGVIEIDAKDWEYLERDVDILYAALMGLKTEFGELRPTIPSLTLATFRRRYLDQDVFTFSPLDEFFRPAYYGGRVELYYYGRVDRPLRRYDINSLYPHAMCGPFPNPNRLVKWDPKGPLDKNGTVADLNGLEGMAWGAARAPSHILPLLPHRRKDGRLLFPAGEFMGHWTLLEIRKALELGYEFDLDGAIVSHPMKSPFIEFVTDFYALKAVSMGLKREIYKLALNALYGKFGEHREETLEYADLFSEEKLAELRAKDERVEWAPISTKRADGFYHIPSRDKAAPHSVYCWAAYITSRARVINYEWQEKIAALGGRVYYTDTDSFDTDIELPSAWVGEKIGQLKLVGQDHTPTAIWGAKYYETPKGLALKGVGKLFQPIAYAIASHTPSVFQGTHLLSVKEAVRRGGVAGAPQPQVKNVLAPYDKRIILPSGWTEPVMVHALQEEGVIEEEDES